MINVIYDCRPTVGLKRPDGTQTISYFDDKGIQRVSISSPEKIETLINNREERGKKLRRSMNNWFLIPSLIGIATGLLLARKSSDDVEIFAACGITGIFSGILGSSISAYRLNKRFMKEYMQDVKNLEINSENNKIDVNV